MHVAANKYCKPLMICIGRTQADTEQFLRNNIKQYKMNY